MNDTSPAARTDLVKRLCREAGFDRVGIARADAVADRHRDAYRRWIDDGRHGEMRYLEQRSDERFDPRVLLPGARSVVAVARNYYTPDEIPDDPEGAKLSRYAWGDDYHDIVKDGLFAVRRALERIDPTVRVKCCVDTAPMMEKYWAVAAGIGWLGKHTNVITRDLGSWVFLGELVLDWELEPDAPGIDRCGRCTRCLDACPTDAFPAPYRLDATKCISYWTIEHRGPSLEGRGAFDNWVFGCDVCQDVCPWNGKFATPTDESRFAPRPGNVGPSLASLAALDDDAFRARFRRSPVKRTKLAGLLRNVRYAISEARRRRRGPASDTPPSRP